jgi:transposase
VADAADDNKHCAGFIAENGALAVIPINSLRAGKHPLDKQLYAQRHLIECCFSRVKQFRRVVARFEKTARDYLAVVTLAATILWLRKVSTQSRP